MLIYIKESNQQEPRLTFMKYATAVMGMNPLKDSEYHILVKVRTNQRMSKKFLLDKSNSRRKEMLQVCYSIEDTYISEAQKLNVC